MNTYKELEINEIGTKAYNLKKLEDNNFNVPKWFVIPNKMLSNLEETNILNFIEKEFNNVKLFSVRTSSSLEDSNNFSYAGQFDTYLNVSKDKLIKTIKKILEDINEKQLKYYHESNIKSSCGIIIQEMVNPQKSGVLFTANPQGLLNESVIVVGKGVGANIVEDKEDTTTYYYNLTDNVYYYSKQNDAATLNGSELNELIDISKKIKEIYKIDVDIEWAIDNDEIHILQVRPITTIKNKEVIILDNSNIVESYPYISLPLTQSYVKEAYSRVFYKCFERIIAKKRADNYAECFENMVECVNGRMYYTISNWYSIINALPFGKKIIPIWQEMLGVSDKEIILKDVEKISIFKGIASIFRGMKYIFNNNKNMENLSKQFNEIIDYYNSKYNENLSNEELSEIFTYLVDELSENWDLTLINDMYAFVFTHFLNKSIRKQYPTDYKIITNELITQNANIDSMKPLKDLITIAEYVKKRPNVFNEIKNIKSNEEYYAYIKTNSDLKNKIDNYIEQYGDRCIEELKFESKTFRTSPILLIQKIVTYADQKVKIKNTNKNISIKRKGFTNFYIKNASLGIKNREASRLNRSRIFGMIRNIFNTIANNLYNNNEIENKDDIFYLTYSEIFSYIEDNSNINIKEIIRNRKDEYENYRNLPTYSRLIFDGKIFNKSQVNIEVSVNMMSENKLKGTPCSNGIVTGECIIVKDPKEVHDCKDKILVTKMTDPGWVFLLSQAKGVISEKGSILSHTAIISRELNITSVVGVKNVTEVLKDGDIIKVDGNTGEIEIVERKKANV